MSRHVNSNGTLNAYNIAPHEVLSGDRYGYKLVAVVDDSFWTVYKGLTDWTDEEVASKGDAVSEEVAVALFPSLRYDRLYYR
jgi:hypothetical protein